MTALFVIGRIIFGLYFVYSGFNHLTKIVTMAAYAKSKGVPLASFSVVFAGLLLLLGGLSILLGVYPILGLILLILFLVPVTFMMHQFWTIQDPMQKMGEMVNFLKNMAILGAVLMMFMLSRPWPASLLG
jgi:uncharacterized membrane protein YphA (DoxX/SURF4 family)